MLETGPRVRKESSAMSAIKPMAIFAVMGLALSVQGGQIVQVARPGGSIVSLSGDNDCSEGEICVVDFPDENPFQDKFIAVPRSGYAFSGWLDPQPSPCTARVQPCVVDLQAAEATGEFIASMTAGFYHQPRLLYGGALGVEWGVWKNDAIAIDGGFLFAGDIDGDGDDDVLIADGTSPPEPFLAAKTGVILLNNGDFSFSVAAGDRPNTVHPREVLLADFNGDGMTDVFIADHGYDADPFPGWSNQLLLWTAEGYRDATDQLPEDPTGFTHNAAVGDVDGDGDVDILVANNGGQFIAGPYFLLNDGHASFSANTSRLPEILRPGSPNDDHRPWAAEIADLDGDGYQDLLLGAKSTNLSGESFVYWGAAGGDFHDDEVTVLSTPEYFVAFGGAEVISASVHDINDDGLPDVVLGGYAAEPPFSRGIQILLNAGEREFVDETHNRLQDTAWSLTESWHQEYRFFDFNHDGTVDIVPQRYDPVGANILAWLNDGTGHYVPLRTTLFGDNKALFRFAWGVKVRVGSEFKALEFFGLDQGLGSNGGVVVGDAVITLAN